MSYSNELQSCNLQSLALVVTCRISYLQKVFERHAVDTDVEYNRKLVDAVYYLIEGIKRMMSWLGSRPFTTLDEFVTLHEHIGKATLSIVSLFSKSSRVQSITRNEEFMQEQLREVESRCDDLIKNCANPIILTPATLENVTIRKRPDEPLGLHLHSSQQGVHTIELIRDNTACDSVSKLEPGDQIVEINQQVVVGWQLNSVVKALQKNPKEVILTVRKAPRHFNLQSFNQRRAKNPKTLGTNLKQSTFPKRASKHLSEEGSFDGKAKSCSIGEAPVAASHMTDTVATPSSTADEVFSLSPSSSDTSQLSGYMQESWQSGAEVKPIPRRTSRPTILVNDVWDPQNSLDIPSSSSAVGNTGKKEVLSSYNVVMSTPELRTSESKQLPSHIRT
ncbi:connector enhancer of kinase suppressor of ras 3-like isoform X2 [Watersipora subatra]